jgi:transposase
VASKLMSKSGRVMIEALPGGERNPDVLADLAQGVLRRKAEELQMACDGRFTGAHGQICRLHLDAYDHLTAQIAGLDTLVAEAATPFAALIARLVAIPGVGQRTAEVIVAETGGDMARFPTAARLAAWAGLASTAPRPQAESSSGCRRHCLVSRWSRCLPPATNGARCMRTRMRPC